ncbi:MAG: hypothetical protein IPL27_03540 [Lewinellaceae bacterium]|nr:hypothetical protein [Lewinellaceae bacterium]
MTAVEGLNGEQNKRFLTARCRFQRSGVHGRPDLGLCLSLPAAVVVMRGDGKGHPSSAATRIGQSDDTGSQFLPLGGSQFTAPRIARLCAGQTPVGASFAKMLPPAPASVFWDLSPMPNC